MKPPRARYICLGMFLLAVGFLVYCSSPRTPSQSGLVYKGKPIEAWFYGDRTNFLRKDTQDAALNAFKALGTNAFPFLLNNLKRNQGAPVTYFQLYRALPQRLRKHLPFPIVSDDIRDVTLRLIAQMPPLSSEQLDAATKSVLKLKNPHLRAKGFHALRANNDTEPAFQKFCRALLKDPHPGIRVHSATWLGELPSFPDPQEPKLLFPILLEALQSKDARELALDATYYSPAYLRLTPLAKSIPAIAHRYQQHEAYNLSLNILWASSCLKAHLPPEQQAQLAEAISRLSNSTAQGSEILYK